MILVDTSVWIDHLHSGVSRLAAALDGNRVVMHPFVAGELACGTLKNRKTVLRLLTRLPSVVPTPDEEVMDFIDRCVLWGRGIGYVDAHLLASVAGTSNALLWTRDKRLASVAVELRLGFAERS